MKKHHLWIRFLTWLDSNTMRRNALLLRRPHRSFRMTRRRDYVRSLQLPGYWSLTAQVAKCLYANRRLFGGLVLTYAFVVVVLGGVANQAIYQQINDLINKSAGEIVQGAWGSLGHAGLLLVSAFATPGQLSPEIQVLLALAALLVWMTTVWLLRERMAGRHPRLRDGLYSAGSPLVATAIIAVIAVLQLVPVAIGALVYGGLSAAGLLQEGMGMMLFWVLMGLVATLVLYWMTTTFLALVIVTLPGMYPMRAMKTAGDIVVGRRLRILYRLLWISFTVFLAWIVIMIPVVLLDTGLKNAFPAIRSLPMVPFVAAFMGAATLVWTSASVYLLYRRIIQDDASPA